MAQMPWARQRLLFFHVANPPPPPPPPPMIQPPSMKATGGRVCLEPASATKEGLPIKSPPTDRPP
eukprot:8668106-Prorocentrum_lima.AAC.1